MSLILPWPVSELSPNSRNRWAKIKAVKAARDLAAVLLLSEGRVCLPAKVGGLHVIYKFYPPTRRAFDLDGLVSRCKAYQDGIFDGLGINDNLIIQLSARRCEVLKNGAVEIIICEATDD